LATQNPQTNNTKKIKQQEVLKNRLIKNKPNNAHKIGPAGGKTKAAIKGLIIVSSLLHPILA